MRTSRLRIVLIAALVFLPLCLGGFVYQYQKKHGSPVSFFSVYTTKIKTWYAERKNHLHRDVSKAKTVAVKSQAAPQIHFEFYDALPNMQMIPPKPASNSKLLVEKTNAIKSPAKLVQEREHLPPANKSAIVSANELEQELSKEFKQINYIVQIGLFRNSESAYQFRKDLARTGFNAGIVETSLAGKDFYRVQLGPFLNREQAKIAEKELHRKGINAIVRKV